MERKVGVLALQGDFEPHLLALEAVGAPAREVRAVADLEGITHLVLPGGESTTVRRLLLLFGLDSEIVRRFREGSLVLFGTCAGAILLGRDDGTPPKRLGLLDATCARNAYGRQVDSFTSKIRVPSLGAAPFTAVFIRAPKITLVGSGVEILARSQDGPLLLRAPGILASTFHPELTSDSRIHAAFLAMTPAPMIQPAAAPHESPPARRSSGDRVLRDGALAALEPELG